MQYSKYLQNFLLIKRTAVLFVIAACLSLGMIFTPLPSQAAGITSMSITSGAITANSVAISTALTATTISFTLATAIGSTDTLKVVLNGTITSAALASADVTVGGTCSGTVTIAGSPIAISTSNPTLSITGVTCTSGAATVIVATGRLNSSSTAGNYGIAITTPSDTGAFLFYVGDENDVSVTAVVDPTISFTIRNTADTADQGNVGGGAVGPNLCNLGNLSDSSVQTCSYRLKVSTNAISGYTVNIATDGDLRNAGNTSQINNVTENTTVTGGTEGYGIAFDGGSSTTGSITEAGLFNDDDTPIGSGTNTTLYSSSGPNNPASTDTTNTALVTHRAEADSGTPTGSYSQLVTYTVTASF